MKVNSIPYMTPVMRYDPAAKVVVIQHRQSDTGDVSDQIPSEGQLKRMRQEQETGATEEAAAPEPAGTAEALPDKRDGEGKPRVSIVV
jgi:hypothetical protein